MNCNHLPRRRWWHPTPVLLPRKSHGQRSLVCCSPWGREESDTNEQVPFHVSLSCIGEENGNPLQCSCIENPREPGGLPSMGSHRVRHDWSDVAAAAYTGGKKKNTSQHTISCHRFSEILIQAWLLPLISYLFLLFNVGGFQGGECSNLLTL